jgi:hypothetical protein
MWFSIGFLTCLVVALCFLVLLLIFRLCIFKTCLDQTHGFISQAVTFTEMEAYHLKMHPPPPPASPPQEENDDKGKDLAFVEP